MTSLSATHIMQNNFARAWLDHLASRMVLLRDLGVMKTDEMGRWVDTPLADLKGRKAERLPPDSSN